MFSRRARSFAIPLSIFLWQVSACMDGFHSDDGETSAQGTGDVSDEGNTQTEAETGEKETTDGEETEGDGDGDGDGEETSGDGDGDGEETSGDGDGDGEETSGDGDTSQEAIYRVEIPSALLNLWGSDYYYEVRLDDVLEYTSPSAEFLGVAGSWGWPFAYFEYTAGEKFHIRFLWLDGIDTIGELGQWCPVPDKALPEECGPISEATLDAGFVDPLILTISPGSTFTPHIVFELL